ncbi:protein-glutamate methylesterase/protein-glutamine glutaminase [Beggiatoa leptomitoformis]|uniref:Protein-glutamate methylesterase/protein-glutamine glutaminase n=1 Tax=Beggiatoa leptomitoformis TaxID=288004 RepID=A0A2N9YF63_9GAMM|nr:chemotaxis response regulator protein-glutamate methylesterase [Beggiatoa leptomitoformis]ALG69499.2 chemotaxis-specific protein-glutamate methyltransferase CheB [Beggiatoa leptomitoformis]AUI69110.1 chemotaxis-specific protein-glutamate methyltransferase CheB [Beggiatoa leptomitoformis]
MDKIRVLVVDDSALIRQMLSKIINATPDLEVVGTASDPYIAKRKIKELNPDVLTLDVEMPRMDGLAFLRNLMRLHPMPVVMVSALTEKGAETTLQALEYGAIDYVSKPQIDIADTFYEYAQEINGKIRMAAEAKVKPMVDYKKIALASQPLKVLPKFSADIILENTISKFPRHFKTTEKIVAIGASTGGTEAIKVLLSTMPANAPGIVISQHIPAVFSTSFTHRMNQISVMQVLEAKDGDVILPGHVYIAPGSSHHLLVVRDGARYVCHLDDGQPVNRHRPSVDVLFRSIAQNVGPNAIGIILTGMGDDGARGMKEMHDAGALTIAQDRETSVVWGMPGEAVNWGGVDFILPLSSITGKVLSLCEHPVRLMQQ